MSHVSISKSYAVLVGLEAYVTARKKGKEAVRKLTRRKDKIVAPEEVRRRDEEQRDKTESAARERKTLEREEQERRRREREGQDREGSKPGVQLMQRLHITSQEAGHQKSGDGRGKEGERLPDGEAAVAIKADPS